MQASLNDLHDIYVPQAIGFEWTEGYILVGIFLSSLLITGLYLLGSYLLATRFRRTALKELTTLQKSNDIPGTFELVKRVLLTTNQREDVASLSADTLVGFMGTEPIVLQLNSTIFKPNAEVNEQDYYLFFSIIKKWIKEQKAIYD